ncbi:MAG: P1 family peptidase [Steroidobacteraceae bacterium]
MPASAADAAKSSAQAARVRARAIGIAPGTYEPGLLNAITDVDGVRVGQVTLIIGESTRTGVTAVLPHAGNLFQDKVPAGLAVANGFGKLAGATQILELGEIETPIVLTNTLAVGRAVEAVVDWTLRQPGNERVKSVNAVVGETNDGTLNDIRRRGVRGEHVVAAIEQARAGAVEEGAVGAGTGTIAFGSKGGIGTSSRRVPAQTESYAVGVLVQTNFGGTLNLDGAPVDGSIMIVIATDAPLSDRNLVRLARRAFAGLARSGAAFSNGSGDYALAFSTARDARRTATVRSTLTKVSELPNDQMSPLFVAVADATEEAIYNSLLMATSMSSIDAATGQQVQVEAIDAAAVRSAIERRRKR